MAVRRKADGGSIALRWTLPADRQISQLHEVRLLRPCARPTMARVRVAEGRPEAAEGQQQRRAIGQAEVVNEAPAAMTLIHSVVLSLLSCLTMVIEMCGEGFPSASAPRRPIGSCDQCAIVRRAAAIQSEADRWAIVRSHGSPLVGALQTKQRATARLQCQCELDAGATAR